MVTTCMLTRLIRSAKGISMVGPGRRTSRLGASQPKHHTTLDLFDHPNAGRQAHDDEHEQCREDEEQDVHDDLRGMSTASSSSLRRPKAITIRLTRKLRLPATKGWANTRMRTQDHPYGAMYVIPPRSGARRLSELTMSGRPRP